MFVDCSQGTYPALTSATLALPPAEPGDKERALSAIPWRAAWETRGRRVVLLLAIVWVLNLIDLRFTLFESLKYNFVELNPVAALLLGISPAAAVAYKLLLVAGASVILLTLRHHRIAEVSSWLSLGLYVWVAGCWSLYFTVMPAEVPSYWPPLLASS